MASSPFHASKRRIPAVLAAGAALLGLAASSTDGAPARAQVLEIAPDGKVAVYDRPAVFTETGVQAIPSLRPPPPPAHWVSGSAPTSARKIQVMETLSAAASAYSLSPDLVQAVAWRESRFRHDAVSSAGAMGVMQLMPATARAIGVDPFDIRQNIYGGTAYLRRMLDTFGGDVSLGLAAYNAGPEAVRRYGGVPPYAETQNYVAAILGRLADRTAPPSPIH